MLLAGLKAAKFIRRGDLWRAHSLLDTEMRSHLLTLITWHARARFGPKHDTWYNGRYLETWADPRVLAALPATYSRFAAAETWQALLAMLILYRWLAEETADLSHLDFPHHAAEQTLAWIQAIYLTNPPEDI